MEISKWVDVNKKLPKKGQIVLTYRPLAQESGDEIYTIQKFMGKSYTNISPQGIIHHFDR